MGKEEIQDETAKVLRRIIKKRQELGVSQKDLALQLHLSFNGYFKIEKGYTSLSVPRLLEIAKALKVKPNFFLKD